MAGAGQAVTEDKKLYLNLGHCWKTQWQTVTNRDKVSAYTPKIVGIYRESIGKL